MFEDALANEIARLEDAEKWACAGLKKAPKGILSMDSTHRGTGCYQRMSHQDKKGRYLSEKDADLIRALAQKDYEQRLLKVVQAERARLERVRRQRAKAGADPLAQVYEQLAEARKKFVTPYELPDEEYARQWQAVEYVRNGHPFGAYSVFTCRGEQVRSKSEVIIADALDAAGVPYRYEQVLYLGGLNPVYPDFTVLNVRTRAEYVWEHQGGMDDPAYREAALRKINDYALAGYLPGKNLIVTQETAETPLDTRVVNELIKQFLL